MYNCVHLHNCFLDWLYNRNYFWFYFINCINLANNRCELTKGSEMLIEIRIVSLVVMASVSL